MPRCEGRTRTGRRCLRMLSDGMYCADHAGQGLVNDGALMAIGVIVGHAIAPGLGGAIGGAVAAKAASVLFASTTKKRKVFVSFDFDNDQRLKHLLVGQVRLPDSPFEVIDGSLKEAALSTTGKQKRARPSDAVIL
jgi:hypothetical protein